MGKRNYTLGSNKVFLWIALATGLILMVPLAAMHFTEGVNWNVADFIVMGALLFGTGSLFVVVERKVNKRYRTAVGVVFLLALLYVWAELAVGILNIPGISGS